MAKRKRKKAKSKRKHPSKRKPSRTKKGWSAAKKAAYKREKRALINKYNRK